MVDEADRPVGIVSRGDLLRIYLRPDHMIRGETTGEVPHRTCRWPLAGAIQCPPQPLHCVDQLVQVQSVTSRSMTSMTSR